MHSPANRPTHAVGRCIALLATLLSFATAICHAQPLAPSAPTPQPSQSPTIADIRVEGNSTASANAIISFSGLRIGDALSSELVAQAIRNLMDRQIFSDVKVYAAQAAQPTSVTVVIVVSEFPRAASGSGAVAFVGNDQIDDDDLRDLVAIRPGDIISPYALDRAADRIRDKYSDEGYLFTDVTPTTTPAADSSRVNVVFTIDEGPEVHIGSIVFVGNTQVDDGDLAGAMEDVKEKSWWQFWRSSKFDRSKLAEDEKRVADYYRSIGFIDAQVTGDSIEVDPASGDATITIHVEEGTRYYLRNVAIAGNTVYTNEQLMARLDVEKGEPYNQVQFDKNVNGNDEQTDLRALYTDNGYLTFNASIDETRVPGTDSIDVLVQVQEGQQATIRYVTIAGNTKTLDKVIRRELRTEPGETFSRADVIRSLRNLANLNYFNPETLRPDVAPVDNTATTVDVKYNVEERPSDTFNASVGISSQGITGVLGLSFNNFDITEPFTAGGGQILNFNWEFGSYISTFSLGWTDPWFLDSPFTVGANVFHQTQDYVDFTARRTGGSVTVGHRLHWPDDYSRFDVVTRYLSNELVGQSATTSAFQNGSELSATLTFSRSSIDNPVFPSVGSKFVFSNTVAGFADAEYTKHELSFDFYSPLANFGGDHALVLYLNNGFGVLNDFGNTDFVPPTEFYVMGGTVLSGINTIPLRGYSDRSIGPIINDLRLGRVYAKTTAELRFGILMNPIPIFALAFAEAGNVWLNLDQVDPFTLRRSVGVGVRMMVPPIGLLGVDFGYGFDPLSGQPSWQTHFQFGH